MTRRRFLGWIIAAMIIYLLMAGLVYAAHFAPPLRPLWVPTKVALPFLVAVPAAWLGFCIQRRLSFLRNLREYYSATVQAVQEAIQYTHTLPQEQREYGRVLSQLSVVIDELRARYRNVAEGKGNDPRGLYPVEPIWRIWDEVARLIRVWALRRPGSAGSKAPHHRALLEDHS